MPEPLSNCSHCGVRLEPDESFCPSCGAKLVNEEITVVKKPKEGIIRLFLKICLAVFFSGVIVFIFIGIITWPGGVSSGTAFIIYILALYAMGILLFQLFVYALSKIIFKWIFKKEPQRTEDYVALVLLNLVMCFSEVLAVFFLLWDSLKTQSLRGIMVQVLMYSLLLFGVSLVLNGLVNGVMRLIFGHKKT